MTPRKHIQNACIFARFTEIELQNMFARLTEIELQNLLCANIGKTLRQEMISKPCSSKLRRVLHIPKTGNIVLGRSTHYGPHCTVGSITEDPPKRNSWERTFARWCFLLLFTPVVGLAVAFKHFTACGLRSLIKT